MTVAELKAAAIAKAKNYKILWYVILALAIILVGLVTFIQVKRYRENKKLQEGDDTSKRQVDTGPAAGEGGSEWPLKEGSKGARVEALQKLVNVINKNANLVPDGDFGSRTRKAVEAINPAYYPVTAGVFSELATLEPREAPVGRPAGPGNDDLPLKEGSRGDKVTALQKMINQINPAAKLAENGIFDHKTYLALITYVGTRFYPVTLEHLQEIDAMRKAKMNFSDEMFMDYARQIRGGPHQLIIGGRNCVKQWDVPTQKWIWNCGGGYLYNTHQQPI